MADLEVAHGDAWEAIRRRPVLSREKALQHVDPVEVVIVAEKRVEHKELPDSVQHVQAFHEDVRRCEVVAVKPSPDETADLGDGVLHADATACPVISLR